jgi:hypothetical protein
VKIFIKKVRTATTGTQILQDYFTGIVFFLKKFTKYYAAMGHSSSLLLNPDSTCCVIYVIHQLVGLSTMVADKLQLFAVWHIGVRISLPQESLCKFIQGGRMVMS